MLRPLSLHPDSTCPAVSHLQAEAARPNPETLLLRFRLAGSLETLALPPAAVPERTDELWRHTCFEAFVRPKGGEGYFEINISPSARWAAYRFDGYRAGMASALAQPAIAVESAEGWLELRAEIVLEDVAGAPWQVGLTAVVEDQGGRISYWALAHPPGRPDFHHPAGLVLELSA